MFPPVNCDPHTNPVFSPNLSHPPSFSISVSVVRLSLSLQVERPSVQSSKPKKTSVSHKPQRKAKDKQVVSGRAAKKKSAEASTTPAAAKEQSKEMNNKLAEAKE